MKRVRRSEKKPDVYTTWKDQKDSSSSCNEVASRETSAHSEYQLVYLHDTVK